MLVQVIEQLNSIHKIGALCHNDCFYIAHCLLFLDFQVSWVLPALFCVALKTPPVSCVCWMLDWKTAGVALSAVNLCLSKTLGLLRLVATHSFCIIHNSWMNLGDM